MSYFCRGNANGGPHCSNLRHPDETPAMTQCDNCRRYQLHCVTPRYPVPAIRYSFQYLPGDTFDPDMWLYLVDWSSDDAPLVQHLWIEGN